LSKLDKDGLQDVSQQMGEFAGRTVPRIVAENLGSLVYAGGDDVLAFVPASRALACADRTNTAFRKLNFPGVTPTCSAAVVIAHYKTPLRIVLAEAREAEQAAKRAERNCLAVRVMKRSGEQATAVVGWEQVGMLEQFVADFRAGATDRWSYRFRQQLDDLTIPAMWPAELKRLLGRAEPLPKGFDDRVLSFWHSYQAWSEKRLQTTVGNRRPTWPLSFVHLIQAASFLSRGGKE
jgi:CRISPR-associated protein Cmr2